MKLPLSLFLAVLLIAPAVLKPLPRQSVEASMPPGRNVLMYYVPYDSKSFDSFQANVSRIDYILPQWVTIDGCGQLGSSDDQTLKRLAAENRVKVIPTLATFSAWLDHRILTDPAATRTAISQFLAYVAAEGYAGLDLDLEGVDPADRDALTAFVGLAAGALHEQGKILLLALPAKSRETLSGWSGAYDYAGLGASADLVTIMTYEYSGAWGDAGPIAPFNWVDQVMAYASSQIAPEKLMLGLAFYGYVWNTTSGGATALDFDDAATLAARYQSDIEIDGQTRSATFSFQTTDGKLPRPRQLHAPAGHSITRRGPGACAAVPPTPAPSTRRDRTPAPGVEQEHVVWLEEARSAAARLNLVDKYGLSGIGAWRLGQEDAAVWPVLEQWKSTR